MLADVLIRVLGSEIVKLYVGPKRKEIVVHKKLICDRSSFFRGAFAGESQKAAGGLIYLPEDDADSMASYIDFLYRKAVPELVAGDDTVPKLYFLAEKLCDSELTNKLLDGIQTYHGKHNSPLSERSIFIVYANTHEKSKLRWFCVVVYAYWLKTSMGRKSWSEWKDSDMPSLFPRDVLNAQVEYWDILNTHKADSRKPRKVYGFGPCEFHFHEKDEKCYRVLDGPK
jgi:hypothetical protein